MGIMSLQTQLKDRDHELNCERKLRKKFQHQIEFHTEQRLVGELLPANSLMNNNNGISTRQGQAREYGRITHFLPLPLSAPQTTAYCNMQREI